MERKHWNVIYLAIVVKRYKLRDISWDGMHVKAKFCLNYDVVHSLLSTIMKCLFED